MTALRRRTGFGRRPPRGLCSACRRRPCHRVLRRHGLVCRPKEREPVVRYEHEHPGGLAPPRHQEAGTHRGRSRATAPRATARDTRRGVGWEVLHVAIDDATRLVYAELLPDERAGHDGALHPPGPALVPRAGRDACGGSSPTTARPIAAASSVRSSDASASSTPGPGPTAPDERQGERWIRTVLSECLYVEVFASSDGAAPCARALHRLLQRDDAPTRASADGPHGSGSARSSPPDGVTNVAGDNTATTPLNPSARNASPLARRVAA